MGISNAMATCENEKKRACFHTRHSVGGIGLEPVAETRKKLHAGKCLTPEATPYSELNELVAVWPRLSQRERLRILKIAGID